MPQSLSSSMQGYHGSEKIVDENKSHAPASIKLQQLPHSPLYNLSQFEHVHGVPPLAFRKPIQIAERINSAKNAIKDFDGKMNKG
ncbi:uncharacterized protein EAF01_002737 [Botrytis porri]|uniref:Uncharacterized protein n=1 Tax=Botrytis porri TaxID=87229 RepID=A0A4Z1KWW6_9HELO|nr:uncharacterized protein EAF01_002737 [Botrytis porri]KAF7911229.1 hypothetical protein EAF01_002737 [Botrytis porri]TGO89077.1 hypothetical protein BPOR_0126g00080 [Botrytis porri]